jgi:hypothetical protein
MLQKDYKVFMPLELHDDVVMVKSDVEIEGSTGADHTRTIYDSYKNHSWYLLFLDDSHNNHT